MKTQQLSQRRRLDITRLEVESFTPRPAVAEVPFGPEALMSPANTVCITGIDSTCQCCSAFTNCGG